MKINLNRYKPPKQFFRMTMNELLRYNKKCIKLDNLYIYKIKGGKRNKTRNKKNRKTRKRKKRTRRLLSKYILRKL